MTDDIEACLSPVLLRALSKCELPANEVITWCTAVHKRDRVKFICDHELQGLRQQFEALPPSCPPSILQRISRSDEPHSFDAHDWPTPLRPHFRMPTLGRTPQNQPARGALNPSAGIQHEFFQT